MTLNRLSYSRWKNSFFNLNNDDLNKNIFIFWNNNDNFEIIFDVFWKKLIIWSKYLYCIFLTRQKFINIYIRTINNFFVIKNNFKFVDILFEFIKFSTKNVIIWFLYLNFLTQRLHVETSLCYTNVKSNRFSLQISQTFLNTTFNLTWKLTLNC